MQFWIDIAMSAKIPHGNGRGNFLALTNEDIALELCRS